jgi:hypothetical protein
MTSFPSDTNTSAVILFDYGDATFSIDYDLCFTRHTRIKILKKAGFQWGNVVLGYFSGQHGEKIGKIDGLTSILEPDGTVRQIEMDSDAIFKEEVREDYVQIRFTLPALAEGCVIEYKYTRTSDNPHYLPDWDFQTTEPTLWSEYRAITPTVFRYAIVHFGDRNFAISETRLDDNPWRPNNYSGLTDKQAVLYHYARSNVPALREEPYITTLDDYRAKLMVQLSMVMWPGYAGQPILQSWPKLMEAMLKEDGVDDNLSGTKTTRNLAKALTDTITDPVNKIIAIYDFVRNTIVWNSENRLRASQDPDEVLETKKGNCAEINYLLVSMLRDAGIEAVPVLSSTRSHGKISKIWPLYTNFDYVIAHVKAGGSTFLLDATDRLRPYNVLPTRALNHEGLLLQEGPETWVPIEPGLKSREATSATVTLAEDGGIRGTIMRSFADYHAFHERVSLSGKKEEDYIKGLLHSETSGVVADSFSFVNRDDVKEPLIVNAHISAPTYAQVLDDFIYVNPMLSERTMENPFKLRKRSFPIDMPYGSQSTFKLDMTIPAGYVVKEVPPPFNTGLPLDGGSYSRVFEVDSQKVSMLVRMDITKTYIEASKYENIRLMFEQIVAREGEQIVLAKATPPPVVEKPRQASSAVKSKKGK